MRITIKDDIAEKYEVLGDDLKKIYDYGLAEATKDFAETTKVNYLKGQAMKKVTGELYDSVKFLRTKNRPELSYTATAGVGVKGHLNYLNKYVGTSKEFIQPSFKAWKNRKAINKILEANFDKIAKAKGLM